MLTEPLAERSDVEELFRALTPAEAANVESWLTYLSAIVRHRVPDVEARMDADDDYHDLVVGTICQAAIRVFRNPQGVRQFSYDDVSLTRDTLISSGQLYLSADELLSLMPHVGALRGAYTVSLWGSGC